MSAPAPLTPAERQRRFREAKRAAGLVRREVILDAQAQVKLDAWCARGMDASEVISMLLRRSKP